MSNRGVRSPGFAIPLEPRVLTSDQELCSIVPLSPQTVNVVNGVACLSRRTKILDDPASDAQRCLGEANQSGLLAHRGQALGLA